MPVDEYLEDLRRERFSPMAFGRFARRLARHVRESMVANPGAVRSVWSLALLYFALAFGASVAIALRIDHHLAVEFFLRTALGILPVFALVTFSLDLLRDPQGYRLSAINVPTALTLLRVVLAPGIVLFLERRHFELALALYLFAALSDIADGWIARASRQITRLGTVIDPVGDIVFNLAILWGLWSAHLLPTWVFAVGALRYAVLLIGGISLHLFVGPVRIRPTWFGRAASAWRCRSSSRSSSLSGPPGLLALRLAASPRSRSADCSWRRSAGSGTRLVQPQAHDAARAGSRPCGRAMCAGTAVSAPSLEGDLYHFFPSEISQLLHLRVQANGRLLSSTARRARRSVPERGRPVFASHGRARGARRADPRAPRHRHHRGDARAGARDAAGPSGRAARQHARVERTDHTGALEEAVRDVLRRIVYGVLMWREGRFRFYPGERVASEDIRLDLDVDRLILEGLRHADQQREDTGAESR